MKERVLKIGSAFEATQSGMKASYKYNRIVCPVCYKEVAENWIVRHLRKYHAGISQKKLEKLWRTGGQS